MTCMVATLPAPSLSIGKCSRMFMASATLDAAEVGGM